MQEKLWQETLPPSHQVIGRGIVLRVGDGPFYVADPNRLPTLANVDCDLGQAALWDERKGCAQWLQKMAFQAGEDGVTIYTCLVPVWVDVIQVKEATRTTLLKTVEKYSYTKKLATERP